MSIEEQNKVALVIMAHPDDAEFNCAGTVARWAREGWSVHYVVCTDASGGGLDEARDVGQEARRAISETRKAEQRAAADVLGVKDVVFLDEPDGILQPTLDLRRNLVRLLRSYRPSRVIVPSPDRVWKPSYYIRRHHPDHLATGQAALAAIYPASQNAWDFPELLAAGLLPHKVAEIYVTNAPEVNCAVDISSTLDLKMEALRAHVSQVAADFDETEKWMRKRAAELGELHEMGAVEEFHYFEND
jgi:LmbE family N-acetylglucosaminyl deacetylase